MQQKQQSWHFATSWHTPDVLKQKQQQQQQTIESKIAAHANTTEDGVPHAGRAAVGVRPSSAQSLATCSASLARPKSADQSQRRTQPASCLQYSRAGISNSGRTACPTATHGVQVQHLTPCKNSAALTAAATEGASNRQPRQSPLAPSSQQHAVDHVMNKHKDRFVEAVTQHQHFHHQDGKLCVKPGNGWSDSSAVSTPGCATTSFAAVNGGENTASAAADSLVDQVLIMQQDLQQLEAQLMQLGTTASLPSPPKQRHEGHDDDDTTARAKEAAARRGVQFAYKDTSFVEPNGAAAAAAVAVVNTNSAVNMASYTPTLPINTPQPRRSLTAQFGSIPGLCRKQLGTAVATPGQQQRHDSNSRLSFVNDGGSAPAAHSLTTVLTCSTTSKHAMQLTDLAAEGVGGQYPTPPALHLCKGSFVKQQPVNAIPKTHSHRHQHQPNTGGSGVGTLASSTQRGLFVAEASESAHHLDGDDDVLDLEFEFLLGPAPPGKADDQPAEAASS